MCVQHREDPCEREGSDQCRSYLRHRISAAWTPLRYRPLSACWDTAGPSTLQRGQHLGNQFVNSYADCEMMCIFLAVFILHVFSEPVCQPNVAYETIKSEAIWADLIFRSQCDYSNVPTVVLTPLEYAACGLSEEKANVTFGEASIEVHTHTHAHTHTHTHTHIHSLAYILKHLPKIKLSSLFFLGVSQPLLAPGVGASWKE